MIPRSAMVRTGISGSGRSARTAMIAVSSMSLIATSLMARNLHPFERQRDSLADADAHGRERELAAAPPELLRGGQREASAGHSERVAERDCAAVGVHLRRIVG